MRSCAGGTRGSAAPTTVQSKAHPPEAMQRRGIPRGRLYNDPMEIRAEQRDVNWRRAPVPGDREGMWGRNRNDMQNGPMEQGGRNGNPVGGRGRGDGVRGGPRGQGQGPMGRREWPRGRGEGPGGRGGARGRGGGSRERDPARNHTTDVRKFGLKTLHDLLGKDSSEVAITLSSSPGFQTLLEESQMGYSLIQTLCQIMSKALGCKHERVIVQHLAGVIKDSTFLRTVLPPYIAGMISESVPARRAQYPQHLDNIISVLLNVGRIFPSSSVRVVSVLVTLLRPAINELRASGVTIPEQLAQNLGRLEELLTHLQEKTRDGTLRSDNYTFLNPEETAPPGEGDYRTMTIYPTPEEIHGTEKPFLRPNIMSHSYSSNHVYLDTHFRLLREDFVRPLREGIRQLLECHQDERRGGAPVRRRRFDDVRIYFDTHVVVPLCTSSGISYKVQFNAEPLKFVRWENTKRLLFGSLVCLSQDNFETFLFATVSDRAPEDLRKGVVQLSFLAESRPALTQVQGSDTFVMVETSAYFEAYRHVLEGLKEQDPDDLPFHRYIVACQSEVNPPVYLHMGGMYNLTSIAAPGFEKSLKPLSALDPNAWPTMEQLGLDESQMRALKLALTKEVAVIQGPPGTGKTYVGLKIAQALLDNSSLWQLDEDITSPMLVVCYTNHALDQFLEGIYGFMKKGIVRVGSRSNSANLKEFNLRMITRDFRVPSHLRLAHSGISQELSVAEQKIRQHSSQLMCSMKGILHERYIERYIMDSHWESLNNCMMENVFHTYGEKQSIILEWLGLGLSVFQQGAQWPADQNPDEDVEEAEQNGEDELIEVQEEAELIQAERFLDEEVQKNDRHKKKTIDEAVKQLATMMLTLNFDSKGNAELTQEPSEGQAEQEWQEQRHQKKKMRHRARKELEKTTTMSEEEEDQLENVWMLNLNDRWRLYRLWLLRYQTNLRARALQAEQQYQNAAERLAEIRMKEDAAVLRRARVIGMTTTGAAKYRQALQDIQPRLIIVEEAAEVLEAHIITTLSRGCQHLILIGDHQQLRPSATVYELAKNFNLEVSLFERLVKLDFPYVRLNYQHRMRPEIARLLTPHIYKELENHPSVMEFENIKGVLSNLYFVQHESPEEEIHDGRSHQNLHEAHFVVALCQYLLHQEYKPSQITILTTYTGQLFCLRKLMPALRFASVKVHVVDKYQGEENDIILLSLVRSNLEGRVGFLNIANRVCVALSRAKKGLYCIGNMSILGKVQLWSSILHTLREGGQVGPYLMLSCQNHPKTHTLVSCAKDFKQVPEGGCKLPCDVRLSCGHVCTRACHPYDADHKKFKCNKPCTKVLCELGHVCPKACHEECLSCQVLVEKVIPMCSHKQMVPCHKDPSEFVCEVPCKKMLNCGHPCRKSCGKPCTERCQETVIMELPCGHSQKSSCYYQSVGEKLLCHAPCKATLICGHACSGSCHKCYQGRFHEFCTTPCRRILICSHECCEPCTQECPPCQRLCKNRCVHSVCKKACGQPCSSCMEPCAWRCPHYSCSKLCHEPCDRPPCNASCDKTLKCGHPCIGLCGETCPKKCRVCHQDEVTEILFGNEDDPTARFIQLEDCGHIFESTGLDTYMKMDVDADANHEQRAIRLKECPKCRTPIRQNLRYGADVNRCLAEIERVKEHLNGSSSAIAKKKNEVLKVLKDSKELREQWRDKYKEMYMQLKGDNLTLGLICEIENKAVFLEQLGKLTQARKAWKSKEDSETFDDLVSEILNWLKSFKLKFSEQQTSDIQNGIQRLTYLAKLNQCCYQAGHQLKEDRVRAETADIRTILERKALLSQEDETRVKQELEELQKKFACHGLGITDDERLSIVKAINLPKGHWYKCPNGHVYAIGDCGGAMVSRMCPECKATIGGENHTLAPGNSVASEMDGAQHAAWSEAANLLNFDLNRLDI